MNETLSHKLLTYAQLAEALQVSPGTLRNWVSQRFIPHIKLGRSVRFDPDEVQSWLSKRAASGRLRARLEV